MCKSRKNTQAGFSLMELLIVMAVTLIILAAVFSLMRGTITTANTNYEMTAAQQGLRNSQEFLARDILTVGDGIKGIGLIWLPTEFAAEYLTARSAATLDPSNSGYVSIGSIISDNNVPAGVNVPNTNPATTVLERSDRVTLLTTDRTFMPIELATTDVNSTNGTIRVPSTTDFRTGEVYFLTNGVAGTFGTITGIDNGSRSIVWASGDAYGLNRTGNSGSMNSISSSGMTMNLMRVQIVHYYVDAQNRLVRRVFGVRGQGFIDNVVAEHLQTLQFRYVLRPESDTTIFDQPADQIDLTEASAVRMIEPDLRVETAYPLPDGQKGVVLGKTQVGVRNIQFLEAPVPRDYEGNTDLPNPGPTPVITPIPTPTPTRTPTPVPTPTPTRTPTPVPTPTPSASPTPTRTPTPNPTPTPIRTPTPVPTPTPVKTPTPGQGEG